MTGQPQTQAAASNGLYYLHTNHLNTPQVITDVNQQIVWQADYMPFGQTTITTNTLDNPLRFPGQYFDNETGLHYNYFRDYDPSIGRYIESDPIGLKGGLNTYAYVGADPLSFIDPDGLFGFGLFLNEFKRPNHRIPRKDAIAISSFSNDVMLPAATVVAVGPLAGTIGIKARTAVICRVGPSIEKNKDVIQKVCLAAGFSAAVCQGRLSDLDDLVNHLQAKEQITRLSMRSPQTNHVPYRPHH